MMKLQIIILSYNNTIITHKLTKQVTKRCHQIWVRNTSLKHNQLLTLRDNSDLIAYKLIRKMFSELLIPEKKKVSFPKPQIFTLLCESTAGVFLSRRVSHGSLPSLNVPTDRLTVWLMEEDGGGGLDGSPKHSCCHYLAGWGLRFSQRAEIWRLRRSWNKRRIAACR